MLLRPKHLGANALYTPQKTFSIYIQTNSLAIRTQENYTDRSTTATGEVTAHFCSRQYCVVSATDFTAVNLGFLDRSGYYFFKLLLSYIH
jgi:hypothetical protein